MELNIWATTDDPGFDAGGLWRPWAPDLVHQTLYAGHFMPEEAPGPITELIRQLLKR